MSIFLALLHHPVLTRHGHVGTTAVTNVDIHDIARTARTYDVERLFLVTPIELQQELIRRVVWHWTEGLGSRRNEARRLAISLCEVVPDLATARARTAAIAGKPATVVVTGAQLREEVVSFEAMRARLAQEDPAALLLFGTGYGLAPDVIAAADVKLPAIDGPRGPAGYNHLPVRSACAIILDRLLGAVRS